MSSFTFYDAKLMIVITIIFSIIVHKINGQKLITEEEVTSLALNSSFKSSNIFNINNNSKNHSENNSDELINLHKQDTNDADNKFLTSSDLPSSLSTSSSSLLLPPAPFEENITQQNDFITTIVPLSDYIQLVSSSLASTVNAPATITSTSLSPVAAVQKSSDAMITTNNANKEDSILENESRLLTATNKSNTTTAAVLPSLPMKINSYIPQTQINDIITSNNNLNQSTVSQENHELLSAVSVKYNATTSNTNNIHNDSNESSSPFASPSASALVSPLSDSTYVTSFLSSSSSSSSATESSAEDYNQSHLLTMMNMNTDDFNYQQDEPSSISYINNYHHFYDTNDNYSDAADGMDMMMGDIITNNTSEDEEENSTKVDNDDIDQLETTTSAGSLSLSSSFGAVSAITTLLLPSSTTSVPTSVTSAAAVGTTTTSTITTVRTKQGKQINVVKLLPHETLRNFIEDAYIRTPLAILVDASSNSLEKAKALWKDALRSNAALDSVLLAFNASGVTVTYHFHNTKALLAGLDNINESITGGNAFFAIIRGCELIPYDSAIFISAASVPADTNLAQYAAITLLKKRIRLYLIWFGEKTSSENETQEVTGGILGEVAIRSGGEILHIGDNTATKFEEDDMLTLVSDNYKGDQDIEIPLETTMTSLQVKINGTMKTATLVTLNGAEVMLKDVKNEFISRRNYGKIIDIEIPLRKFNFPTQMHLKLIPDNSQDPFHVIIKAKIENLDEEYFERDLMITNNDEDFATNNKLGALNFIGRSQIKLNLQHNSKALHTHEDIRFPNENDDTTSEIESLNSNDEEVKDTVEETKITKNIDNKIENGIAKQTATTNIQGLTIIEMSIHSQLLVAPGMIAQLYFEVTNTRSVSIFYNIRVTDEKGYLLSLNPRSFYLPAGQKVTVTVSIIVPSGTPQGTRDKITFICQEYGQGLPVSQSAELRVISSSEIQDTTPPWVTWFFGTRCEGQYSTTTVSCSQRVWSIELTAQDWETGILRIESSPIGLVPRLSYTIGTNEPVRATYSATCCQPRVTISVYDLAGNQRTSTIDVRDIVLTEASIAAIVLGVLLLIALIILLIVVIIWCCRRRKRSQDLAAYRSRIAAEGSR